MKKIKSAMAKIKKEIKVYQLVLKDKRTPKLAKILLWLALAYFFLPFDLIPDFIPVIGQLDDFLFAVILITLALKIIPKEVIIECRSKIKIS